MKAILYIKDNNTVYGIVENVKTASYVAILDEQGYGFKGNDNDIMDYVVVNNDFEINVGDTLNLENITDLRDTLEGA